MALCLHFLKPHWTKSAQSYYFLMNYVVLLYLKEFVLTIINKYVIIIKRLSSQTVALNLLFSIRY